MSKDMGREELLISLDIMKNAALAFHQHYPKTKDMEVIADAHAQLKAIVEQHFVLPEFFKQIAQQEDMPPKYQKLASEHFWELIGDSRKADTEQSPEPGVDEEKKIEKIRMMIQKATSDYMPVYRRIYLNDAVEVEIRKLIRHISTSGNNMSDKRTVTREWVNQYAWDILTDFNTLPKTNEIRNMEKRLHDVLKELGIEVVEK